MSLRAAKLIPVINDGTSGAIFDRFPDVRQLKLEKFIAYPWGIVLLQYRLK